MIVGGHSLVTVTLTGLKILFKDFFFLSSSWFLFYQRETAVRKEQRGKIRMSKIAMVKY